MRFILVLASAALAAALPHERRDDPMAGMAGMTTTAHHHPASTTAPMPAGMTMMARDVAHGKKGNDEKKKTMKMPAGKTMVVMVDEKSTMKMPGGKTMVVLDDEPEATEMASMPMMARDIEHGKKGMDEKKVSTKAAVKATSAKAAAKATPVKASKMSMAAGKTMIVMDDEPEATEMASMPMMARDVEHGKKGMDEKKVSTKAAVKATSAKAAAKATPVKASKMSMAAGKTMVVLDDEPEATEMSMPMMARDVEHGKKGNDEKKKVVSTKAAAKATPAKMSMAAGKTMVVLDDEPEATEMSMPMMARDVEHGKKGNDEKKKISSSKMKMPAGKTMVVVADEPEATEMSMPMMARDVAHGKKGNDEKKKSTMKMPAGKTMMVMPAVATTFVKVQRDMTMAGMETMAMPASVMSAHHPAAKATTTAAAMDMPMA